MEDSKDIEKIDNEIENKDSEIKKLKIEKKKLKQAQDRSLRLRSNNCGKSNVLKRIAMDFWERMLFINTQREASGRDILSLPKQTHLVLKHKKGWPMIERDMILYNTDIDVEEEEFNEK